MTHPIEKGKHFNIEEPQIIQLDAISGTSILNTLLLDVHVWCGGGDQGEV